MKPALIKSSLLIVVAALSLSGCDKIQKAMHPTGSGISETTHFPIVFECDVTLEDANAVPRSQKVQLFVVLDNGKRGLHVTESPGEEYFNEPNSHVTLTDRSVSYGSGQPVTHFVDTRSINRLTWFYESKLLADVTSGKLRIDGTGTCKIKKDKLF